MKISWEVTTVIAVTAVTIAALGLILQAKTDLVGPHYSAPASIQPLTAINNNIATPPGDMSIVSVNTSPPLPKPPHSFLLRIFNVNDGWNYLIDVDVNKRVGLDLTKCIGGLKFSGGWSALTGVSEFGDDGVKLAGEFAIPADKGAAHVLLAPMGPFLARVDMHGAQVRIVCQEFTTAWAPIETDRYDDWYKAYHPDWRP